MSATPKRADGRSIGRGKIITPAILDQYGREITPPVYDGDGVTDVFVMGPTARDLIAMGNLCDYEYVLPLSDFDLESLKTGADGDFTTPSMKAASEKSHITGDVVENYIKYANGLRAVVFATDVETSVTMATNFNNAGIPAASISGKTDGAVRDDAIRRLRDGRLKVLTSVDILGEGFDLPALDAVIMARPTKSLAVYIQQTMRCMRPAPGKKYGLIIDHVQNVKLHRWPDAPRVWTLDRVQKRAKKEPDPEALDIMVCPETRPTL
jgi:superfamily II DNA or RNA helicase